MVLIAGCGVLQGVSHNFLDELAFSLVVCLPLITKLVREAALQGSVSVRILRMGSKIVSKRDMTSVLLAVGRANVKMMGKIAGWSAEGLAAGNSQIATVVISQQRQFADNEGKIGARPQEDVDVNDRFSGESGNCGAAYMFDRNR